MQGNERLPKRLLYGELSARGEEVYWRSTQTLQGHTKAYETNESSESLVAERGTWRSLIRKGAEYYEQTRIRNAEEKTAPQIQCCGSKLCD